MPTCPAKAETVVRGSRFNAWLGDAADLEGAKRALAERAAAGPDATHHCWAFRLWRGGRIEEAGFDAGEPGGTAGRPILGTLQRADIVQAVCVVSRWFGGIRLGTGGLVRAYAHAAQAAIDAARKAGTVREAQQHGMFRVAYEYPLSGAVERVISRFDARSAASSYGERVELELSIPVEAADAFERALADATAGAVDLRRLEPRLEPVAFPPL
jgi:uncharacterized YigZ family protein